MLLAQIAMVERLCNRADYTLTTALVYLSKPYSRESS
ncbi:hypothetical protein SAMN05720472_1427 [Fibrobacter sp. UWR3]|nr:hypothetical protein SAMN05720472_1427 [Fibrobacter sp. UWR3]